MHAARGPRPSFSFVAPPEDQTADPDAKSHEQMLLRLNAAAVQHHDSGQLGQAQALFQQLVDGRREHNGEAHPLTIYALGWLKWRAPRHHRRATFHGCR